MIRGLYTSGWSMMANNKKMDVIANNLANASTAGFKKDGVIFESFPDVLTRRLNDTRSVSNPDGILGNMQLSHDVGTVYTDFINGGLIKTDSKMDVAISGSRNAFFAVLLPDEQGDAIEMYTRDGSFSVDNNGVLVTKEGFPVSGVNGVIVLKNEDFSINDDGTIVQDGQIVGKLRIKQFQSADVLRKYGMNLYFAPEDAQEEPFTGVIRQGFLEQSNVDVVREMVDMISVMRAYEANQKMIQTQDAMLDKAVNEVGALR